MVHMDITPYVESLRRDLMAAAEAAGPEARELAEKLSYALDPATRLAVMEAISQATAEITAELPSGGVDVRLAGRELEFVVHAATTPATPTAPPVEDDEGDEVARITLRIPETVKARAEELASRNGSSLNTWLVNLVRAATSREGAGTWANIDIDLSSIPFLGGPADPAGKRRMSGWI